MAAGGVPESQWILGRKMGKMPWAGSEGRPTTHAFVHVLSVQAVPGAAAPRTHCRPDSRPQARVLIQRGKPCSMKPTEILQFLPPTVCLAVGGRGEAAEEEPWGAGLPRCASTPKAGPRSEMSPWGSNHREKKHPFHFKRGLCWGL